jgi:cell wall-associated NlpC family hydrolase
MSTTLHRSAMPRRFVSVLIAALFGLTLALNPIAAPKAHAAASVSVRTHALNVAAAQKGIRYVWGGTTPRGFDCSGLTQYAYAKAGKHLPRTSQQQFNATIRKAARHAQPGDLVFFYSGHNVYHVGIYAGGGYMWHAPRTGKTVAKVHIWTKQIAFGRVR